MADSVAFSIWFFQLPAVIIRKYKIQFHLEHWSDESFVNGYHCHCQILMARLLLYLIHFFHIWFFFYVVFFHRNSFWFMLFVVTIYYFVLFVEPKFLRFLFYSHHILSVIIIHLNKRNDNDDFSPIIQVQHYLFFTSNLIIFTVNTYVGYNEDLFCFGFNLKHFIINHNFIYVIQNET